MSFKRLLCAISALPIIAACNPQSDGFVLPPGDAEAGKAAFVLHACNDCHRVGSEVERNSFSTTEIDVTLGGTVTRVKTYGDLVTSIINPSHKLSRGSDPSTVTTEGESKMRLYNDVLTVTDLVNITAFLQENYSVYVPVYPMYHFP